MRSGWLEIFVTLAVLCLPLQAAHAQAHVTESGTHTVRASVVHSNLLSPEAARQHGISVADDRGVLNVVVLEGKPGHQQSVSAEVSAVRTDLVGRAETIAMREVRVNDGVSYIGSFTAEISPTARFRIEVLPVGVTQPLSVEFEERFFTPASTSTRK